MIAGIDQISVYSPPLCLELTALAAARGVPPAKYLQGIGQERMAVPPPDEDIVTMAANAALPLLSEIDPARLDSLILATESGIDQSKAAAIYVHRLLGLPSSCKAFEIKQACCGSTAALQMALLLASQRPQKAALVVATDVARYGLGTPGEPTQGAGAAALLITANPRLLAIAPEHGAYTEDVMDFWRPNYLDEALVDGKLSIRVYLRALEESWRAYQRETGARFGDFARFCYHLPFTRMAEKAHRHLAAVADAGEVSDAMLHTQVGDSLAYGRQLGNSYTAALYVALASTLETGTAPLDGQRLALFSYGSGCMAAFFAGTVQPGYERYLRRETHRRLLADRLPLTIAEYEELYRFSLPTDGGEHLLPTRTTGAFRLAGIRAHQRLYERRAPAAAALGHAAS